MMQRKKDYKKILLERLQTDSDDSRIKRSKGSSVKTQSTPNQQFNLSSLFNHFEQHFSVFNEPVRNFKSKPVKRRLFKQLIQLQKTSSVYGRQICAEQVIFGKDQVPNPYCYDLTQEQIVESRIRVQKLRKQTIQKRRIQNQEENSRNYLKSMICRHASLKHIPTQNAGTNHYNRYEPYMGNQPKGISLSRATLDSVSRLQAKRAAALQPKREYKLQKDRKTDPRASSSYLRRCQSIKC